MTPINSKDDLVKLVLSYPTPVLVKFGTTSCAPCRAIAPHLKAIAEEKKDQIAVVEIDGEESFDLVSDLGVMSFPTLMVFKQTGEQVTELGRFTGSAAKPRLVDWIEKLIGA
jgi:thioredoxin 1